MMLSRGCRKILKRNLIVGKSHNDNEVQQRYTEWVRQRGYSENELQHSQMVISGLAKPAHAKALAAEMNVKLLPKKMKTICLPTAFVLNKYLIFTVLLKKFHYHIIENSCNIELSQT